MAAGWLENEFQMKKRVGGVTEEMMSGLTVVKKRLKGLPPR